MPYRSIQDLPESVKGNLPKHAQEIYLKSFNNAWEEYNDPNKRRRGKNESQEEVAHKVAWSAVKKKYKKQGDEWVSI